MSQFIGHAIKQINLQPVKNIKVMFDPFHKQVESAREFLFALSHKNVRITNPECSVKADVKSDRSDPTVLVKLSDGHELFFKTANLNLLEILQQFNHFVLPRVVVQTQTDDRAKLGKVKSKGKR